MQQSRFCIVLLVLCAARELNAGFVCQAGAPEPARIGPSGGGLTTSNTNSSTCSEQVQTTNLTQRVDQFTTELRARMQGGPLLLDQTFAAAFSDPAVQSALGSAQQLLTAQGAKGFTGPALLGNNTALTNSNTITSVMQSAPPQMFLFTNATVGPGSIQTGNIGQCQGVNTAGAPFGCDPNAGGPFMVQGGGPVNFNTNTHTAYFLAVTNTTTNTFLTSQVYELDGVPAAVTGVPEPGTLALVGMAIPGLWLGLRLRRRREAGI